ncbi:hypothetical protein C9374_013569 [Naegleria lovaniensis]|uniref:Uncharacterized protein n=1 Tax=Naegleria lovaniensis TaxID=51637 RepID=A0AA88GWZ0_NAELO|nr:uncharacterized protein C9374_013569 [Naegleria lovaniensis]KAG2392084.1 hypothetical protein C9374_013569 [Naegleria lovaniensis]
MIDHHVMTSRTNRDTSLPKHDTLKVLQTPTPHIESPSDTYWMMALDSTTSHNNGFKTSTLTNTTRGSINGGHRTSICENSELDMNTIESSLVSSSLTNNMKSFVLDEYIAGLTFDVINSTSAYLTSSSSNPSSNSNTCQTHDSKERSSQNSIIREAVKINKNKRNSTSIVTLSSPTMHCEPFNGSNQITANSFCAARSSTNAHKNKRLSSPQSLFNILQHTQEYPTNSPSTCQNRKNSANSRMKSPSQHETNAMVSTPLPKHLEEIPFDFSNPLMTPRHERKNSLGLALSVDTSISHVKQLFHDDLNDPTVSKKPSLNVQSSKDLNDPASTSMMDLSFEEFSRQFTNNLLNQYRQEMSSPQVVMPPLAIGIQSPSSSSRVPSSISSARSPTGTNTTSNGNKRTSSLNALKRRTITGGQDLVKAVFGFNQDSHELVNWRANPLSTSSPYHVHCKSDDVNAYGGNTTSQDGEVKMKYWDEIDEEETNRKRQSFREFSQNLDLCYSIDVVRPRNRNSTSQMSNVKRLSLTLSSMLSNGCSTTSPQDTFEYATADMSTFATSPQACAVTLSSIANASTPSSSPQLKNALTTDNTSNNLLNNSMTSVSTFPNPALSTLTTSISLQNSPQSCNIVQTPTSRRSLNNNRIRNAHNRRSLSFPTEKLKNLFKKLKE